MQRESKKQKINWSILLHDIRSVQNVASIFRLSECLGVNKIYLSGITPGPLDRFGRERDDFIKISLGAEKDVFWERVEDVERFIQEFRSGEKEFVSQSVEISTCRLFTCQGILKEEFTKTLPSSQERPKNIVIALEQNENSVDYKQVEIDENKRYLVIPGREVEGLDEKLLKMCDVVAEIPQYGKKESLNIFSSLSVSLYRFFDK